MLHIPQRAPTEYCYQPVLHVTVVTKKKRKKKTFSALYACLVCFNLWYYLRKEEVAHNWESCPKSQKLPKR